MRTPRLFMLVDGQNMMRQKMLDLCCREECFVPKCARPKCSAAISCFFSLLLFSAPGQQR